MKQRQKNTGQAGYTLIEVLIAMAILVIVSQGFLVFMRSATKQTVASRLKAEANEHAIQMLDELRDLVVNDKAAIATLQNYSDGRDSSGNPIYRYTLSTQKEITQDINGNSLVDNVTATNRQSANPVGSKGFAFVRRVEISQDPNDRNLRKIHVTVWQAAPNAGPPPGVMGVATPLNTGQPMAEMFGIVRSLASGTTPSQVLDLYLVALENVPGWWSRTSQLIPLMRSSMISLQSANPGLILRPHWIIRMSYGRDPEYTPELNNTQVASTSGVFKKTYIYPGLVGYDDGNDDFYLPTWFKARINMDSTLTLNDGYAMADQWNHAMRLPDEQNLYAIHQMVNANAQLPAPEMSLRMMLETMNSNDPSVQAQMRNSVIINLHGEMLPVLPLRNYSDAAKDPAYYWGGRGGTLPNRAFRAVTHAERLAYSATGVSGIPTTVALRVYAYDMNPPSATMTAAIEDDVIDNITLFIPGATPDNLKSVANMRGNSRYSYRWISQTASAFGISPSAGGPVYYDGLSQLAGSLWTADYYTPTARVAGLRIRLYGTTPTARVYGGSPN